MAGRKKKSAKSAKSAKRAKSAGKRGTQRAASSKPKKSTAKGRKASGARGGKQAVVSAKRRAPRAASKRAAAPAVPPLSTAEKLAIVGRYVAAYNARDTAAILALYDARATMEDPIGLPPAVGHEAIGELYKMGFDMNVSIAHDGPVRCAGNSVAFPLIASSPTSKLHVIDVFDFGRGGKIVQMRAYWGPDNLEGDLAVRQ